MVSKPPSKSSNQIKKRRIIRKRPEPISVEKRDIQNLLQKRKLSAAGSAQSKYDLLSYLEQRGILQSETNLESANAATKYLSKSKRTVYTVLPVDGRPLTLSSLVQINTLLCIGEFGHRPLLVLDDVNGSIDEFGIDSKRDDSATDDDLYSITKQIAKVFFYHHEVVWSTKKRYYDFPQLQVCLLSQLEGITTEQARDIAIQLDLPESDSATVNAVKMGKYISDLNKAYDTTIGLIPPNLSAFSPDAYEVADIINDSEPSKGTARFRQNDYFTLDEHLLLQDPHLLHLDEQLTSPYELYNYLLTQKTDIISPVLLKLTTATAREIKKGILDSTTYFNKRRFVHRLVLLLHGSDGLESAVRLRLGFKGEMDAIAVMTDDELRLLFSQMETFVWEKDFDVTLREFLIESKIFGSDEEVNDEFRLAEEIDSRKIIFNNIVIDNPDQILIEDWHILPNNVSIVRLRRQMFGIKWINTAEIAGERDRVQEETRSLESRNQSSGSLPPITDAVQTILPTTEAVQTLPDPVSRRRGATLPTLS